MKRASSHKEHLERLDIAVQTENVSVIYDGEPVLWDISLDIPSGSVTAVIGPNKGGKTTLLKVMLGLIKPNAGKVYVFSRPTMTLKNDIAWIPERETLDWSFPATVQDVVLMGSYNRLRTGERPKKSDKELMNEALEKTGLLELRKKQISTISRGEQERVLIARALVQNPRIYIMDEPFFSADEASAEIIISVLESIKKAGKTAIVAHHDVFMTPQYFDEAVFINVRKITQGRVPDILNKETLKAAYGARMDYIKIPFTSISDAE